MNDPSNQHLASEHLAALLAALRRCPGRPDQGVLVILCGLSFAGKSTLARALAHALGGVIVSLDAINAQRGLWGGDGIPVEDWARTHQRALADLHQLMDSGVSPVILDDTSGRRFLRDSYRAVADGHGYAVRLVVLAPALAEIERRRRANQSHSQRRSTRDDIFAEHVRTFEWPGPDEDPIELATGTNTNQGLP